jgi:glycosyltransferase involved in cell wall biosynthesis
MIFSWLTDLPFSFTAHAYDIFRQPQFLDRKLAEASFAVTVSAYNKQYMLDHYGAEFERKIQVIYPLIDLSQFAPRPASPNGPLSIVSIGRLTEYKGFIYLIEACRILNERGIKFLCKIVGEGEDRPELEAAIERYRLQESVKLLGSIPHNQVSPLLEQATVFALPCVIAQNGDRDGMPLVLIEAMAREVPVVSSDVIGLNELVRPEVGLLVPPADPVVLADALVRLAEVGPARQQAMGRAGRRIVERELDAVLGATKLAALVQEVHKSKDGLTQLRNAASTSSIV